MTTHTFEPERWSDRPLGGAAEDRAAIALRRARAATVPSEATVVRVGARLFAPAPERARAPRWRLAAVVLVLLVAGAGSVGAARGPLRAWGERHGFVAPMTSPETIARPARTRRAVALVDERAPPVKAPPALEAALLAAAEPAAEAAPQAVRAVARAVEAPEAEEARILEGVFRALRGPEARGGDALAALDDYDRRFPAGVLRVEARLARVEAMLARGARVEALALLDAWEASGAAPRAALAARGDLRAAAGRCGEAATDFAAVLAASADDALGARALYGSAACALRAGDAGAANDALTLYLERHPDGPQAAQARDALAKLSASHRNVVPGSDMRDAP
jgi:hypothetical protein